MESEAFGPVQAALRKNSPSFSLSSGPWEFSGVRAGSRQTDGRSHSFREAKQENAAGGASGLRDKTVKAGGGRVLKRLGPAVEVIAVV